MPLKRTLNAESKDNQRSDSCLEVVDRNQAESESPPWRTKNRGRRGIINILRASGSYVVFRVPRGNPSPRKRHTELAKSHLWRFRKTSYAICSPAILIGLGDSQEIAAQKAVRNSYRISVKERFRRGGPNNVRLAAAWINDKGMRN
jgi:hypothetical protein